VEYFKYRASLNTNDVIRTSEINFTFVWPCIVTNFFIIKPTRCTNFTNFILAWNSTCFRQFVYPSSGVYSLYTQQWCMSYRFVDSFRAGLGWNASSILVPLDSCMTYAIAECTVNKLLTIDRGTVLNM